MHFAIDFSFESLKFHKDRPKYMGENSKTLKISKKVLKKSKILKTSKNFQKFKCFQKMCKYL